MGEKVSLPFEGMPLKKAFVREDGRAIIVCPHCGKAKEISVLKMAKRKSVVNVRCSCSTIFRTYLDYRQSYRKATDLTGSYSIEVELRNRGQAKIKNISFGGICFEVASNHAIREGQKGSIDFELDDKNSTRVRKNFSVKVVTGNNIGCCFIQDRAYDKNLGFYLRTGL